MGWGGELAFPERFLLRLAAHETSDTVQPAPLHSYIRYVHAKQTTGTIGATSAYRA